MNHALAEEILIACFTPREREFLFSHPEFQLATQQSPDTDEGVRKLNETGVRLILQGGHAPPSTPFQQV